METISQQAKWDVASLMLRGLGTPDWGEYPHIGEGNVVGIRQYREWVESP